ncbi:tetratricopeptide repeat protein [Polaribacter sp. R77954]|uniref:tetratricopeptide repeat protein n=1 Tax=Polaribacter sp. R77954 TaxID=3093870 RepID=UPI0037CC8E87
MKIERFNNIITDQTQITQLDTAALKTVIEEYPYFQSARALYLKGLKNQDSFKYNNELKITAAYTTDRTVLFDFITSKEFETSKKEIHKQISNKISEEKPTKTPVENKAIKPEETAKPIKSTEEQLAIGKPIPFIKSENYSFNQWLQLSAKNPIVRKQAIEKPVSKKEKIIEKFIKTNPKIEPLSKDKSISISVAKNKQDAALMTETLAKVYLEQKKYENAIQAYRILILKYPEKSGFFADQIKRIQILQKHK